MPKLRFEEFTDDWEQRMLSAISERVCVGFVGTCEKYYTDKMSGIPMYRTGNLKDLGLNHDDMKYVTNEFHQKNKKSQLKKGDILIARHGENGKAVVYEANNEANCLNIVIIRPNMKKCNYTFLANYINSPLVYEYIKSLSAGSTQAVINTSEIKKLVLQIPKSMDEQDIIAKYFSNLDNLIILQQRKCDELQKVKKYMFQKMFPKKGEKVPEIRFAGFTGDWEQRKLGEITGKTYGGGTPKTDIDEYWNGDIPWIQSSNLTENKLFDVDIRKHVTAKGLQKSATQLVPANSIAVVSHVGVGKLVFMPFRYTTSQDFISLAEIRTEPKFTCYAIYKRLQKDLHIVQGSAIKGITKEDLLNKEIAVPSYEEQEAIGRHFSNLDNLITLHQRKCDTLKEIKKYMLQNMFPKK